MVMATHSPQQVGREFVRQYYTVLHEAPELLHRFYSSGSMFVHGAVDRPGQSEELVIGQLEIDKQIRLLSFKDCHTKIRQVDSQSTIGSGVVVQVTGELSNNGDMMRRFMQTFVLAPQTPKKYYVHNDIFRYQDEVYQDLSDTEAEEQQSQSMQQQSHQTHQEVEVKTSSILNMNYYQSNQNESGVIITHQEEENQVVLIPTAQKSVQEEESAALIEQNILNGNLHSSSSSASSAAPSEANPEKEEEKVYINITENESQQEQHALVIETSNFTKEEEPINKVVQVESTIEEPITVKTNSWAKIITNKTEATIPNLVNNNSLLSSSLTSASQTYLTPSSSLKRPKENKPVLKSKSAQQNGTLTKSKSSKTRPHNNYLNSQQEKKLEAGSRDQQQNQNQMQSLQQQEHQQQQQHIPRQKPQNSGQVNQGQNGNSDMDDIDKRFGHYPDGQQVFVGNLSQDINETELKQFFCQFGKVIEVRINTNTKQQSGRRLPNYGFVVFEDKQVVDNLLGATKSNNLTYKNNKGVDYRLNVEEKRARMGRQSGGGFGNKSIFNHQQASAIIHK